MANLNISLQEISTLLKAIEIAINKKSYTKQEIDQFFPLWNNVIASVEKINRQNIVDQLYAEPAKPIEMNDNVSS